MGGGVVGLNAARIASGMGADVTILERSISRIRFLDENFKGKFKTIFSNSGNTLDLIAEADLIIGAALIPGASAPNLVSKEQLKIMKSGSAIVDVAIDQGGCFETSKPTTHENPIYEVEGIVHYCVANMPGTVARTSTIALGNSTIPFILALLNKGWKSACKDDPHLLNGLNVHAGQLTCKPVGSALNIKTIVPHSALKS